MMMMVMMMMMIMVMMMRRLSSLRVRAKPRHLPYISLRFLKHFYTYLNGENGDILRFFSVRKLIYSQC